MRMRITLIMIMSTANWLGLCSSLPIANWLGLWSTYTYVYLIVYWCFIVWWCFTTYWCFIFMYDKSETTWIKYFYFAYFSVPIANWLGLCSSLPTTDWLGLCSSLPTANWLGLCSRLPTANWLGLCSRLPTANWLGLCSSLPTADWLGLCSSLPIANWLGLCSRLPTANWLGLCSSLPIANWLGLCSSLPTHRTLCGCRTDRPLVAFRSFRAQHALLARKSCSRHQTSELHPKSIYGKGDRDKMVDICWWHFWTCFLEWKSRYAGLNFSKVSFLVSKWQ